MAVTTRASLRTVFLDRCLNDGKFLQKNLKACVVCDQPATTDEECYAAVERGSIFTSYGIAPDSTRPRSGLGWDQDLFVLAPDDGESRGTVRQKRQERRKKRRESRACKRNALACRILPAGSGLRMASNYLGLIQNAEADLRQTP